MKKFKWTVEFSVDELWVVDGFDPDSTDFHEMICQALGDAYPSELGARLIKRPKDKDIAKAQGYTSIKKYRESNWKGRVKK